MYKKVLKKHLGQHFLTDEVYLWKILKKIAPTGNERVFEIGPGGGALTRLLAQEVQSLCALEIDKDCLQYLESQEALQHCTFVEGDILSVDLEALIERHRSTVWVGNLPYNISSPIMMRLIQSRHLFSRGYFMLQKEVADRLAASKNTASYGRLSVMVQAYFDIEVFLAVPPEAFSPPPKVDSAVVEMRVKKDQELLPEGFSKVVAHAFSKRRKMLKGLFKMHLDAQDFEKIGISGALRAENLDVKDFVTLAKYLQSK